MFNCKGVFKTYQKRLVLFHIPSMELKKYTLLKTVLVSPKATYFKASN